MAKEKAKQAASDYSEFHEIQENIQDMMADFRAEEDDFLARLGQKGFTERQRAMQYFVAHFSMRFLNLYIIYKNYASSDTLWKKFIGYFTNNAGQGIAQEAVNVAANDVIQLAGGSAQEQKMAAGAATLAVKIMFFFYSKYKNQEKAERLKIAQKFSLYGDTPDKVKILIKKVAIFLFQRLELFIMDLSRPEGVDKLIDFMMDSILHEIKNSDPPADDAKKIQQLAQYSIPKPNSDLYKILLKNKTIDTDRKDDNWTLLGGLWGAPVLVQGTNRIFGHNKLLRVDGKYPPHFMATEHEATSQGLKCIDEFYWQGFEKKTLVKKLKVLEDFTAILIDVLPYLDKDVSTIWMEKQYKDVADMHQKMYDTSSRDDQKIIFEHLLQLGAAINSEDPRYPWIKVLYSPLDNMFKCLYEESKKQDDKKWQILAERLAEINIDANKYLPGDLHAKSNASATAFKAEAPAPKPVLKNPILVQKKNKSNEVPLVSPISNIPVDDIAAHKIIVKIWEKEGSCKKIAIIVEGATHPMKVHFATKKSDKNSSHNLDSLLHKLDIVEVHMNDFLINHKMPTKSYEFSKLDAGKILKILRALDSKDADTQSKLNDLYTAYTQMPFYNKNISNHLHMAIFLLMQGGLDQLCSKIGDPDILKKVLSYLGGTGTGAGVGAAVTIGAPIGITSAMAASSGGLTATAVGGGVIHFHAAAGLGFLFGPVGIAVTITAGVLLGAGLGALAVYGLLTKESGLAAIGKLDLSELIMLAHGVHELDNAPNLPPPPSSNKVSSPGSK